MASNTPPKQANTIAELSTRVALMSKKAEQRSWIAVGFAVVLVAGVFIYLQFLKSTIDEFAEVDTVVELVASTAEPQINAELDSLGENLIAQTPAMITEVEKVVLESPPAIVAEGQRLLLQTFETQLRELEARADQLIQGMLSTALKQASDQGLDLNSPDAVNALVDDAIALVRKELKTKIDDLYVEYSDGAHSVSEFIDRLASASDLSPIEKEQREVLITSLALLQKLESDPSRSPLQGIIKGDLPEK